MLELFSTSDESGPWDYSDYSPYQLAGKVPHNGATTYNCRAAYRLYILYAIQVL